MRVLAGREAREARDAERFLAAAVDVARGALCHRSRCGSVIVADGVVIGAGRNDPPAGCPLGACGKDTLPAAFRSDRTCCVHAEQNAILGALRRHPARVSGARLYFIRLDADNEPLRSGRPYCTICSKLAQAAGLAEFVLWHPDGITVYDTDEYNRLSFQHADDQHADDQRGK
jgi:deoxycytidylate deaminase